MSDDAPTPARVLPFTHKPRPAPKPPTPPRRGSFLDAPSGLKIDVTVRTPTTPED